MRRRLAPWLAVFAFVGCSHRAAEPPVGGPTDASARADDAAARSSDGAAPAARTARYLALGDSFTAGTGSSPADAFPARLAERFRRAGCEVAVTNLAVNGYTTRDVLLTELPQVSGPAPDLVTLAVGANDLVRGGDVATYRAALSSVFDALAERGIAARVVVTLPQPDWASAPAAADFGDPAALRARIREMNAALRELSGLRGARYVDLSPTMEAQASAGMFAPDGLHPTREAYDAWASELASTLAPPCR